MVVVVVVKWGVGGYDQPNPDAVCAALLHRLLFESHVPDDHRKIRLGPSKQLSS